MLRFYISYAPSVYLITQEIFHLVARKLQDHDKLVLTPESQSEARRGALAYQLARPALPYPAPSSESAFRALVHVTPVWASMSQQK